MLSIFFSFSLLFFNFPWNYDLDFTIVLKYFDDVCFVVTTAFGKQVYWQIRWKFGWFLNTSNYFVPVTVACDKISFIRSVCCQSFVRLRSVKSCQKQQLNIKLKPIKSFSIPYDIIFICQITSPQSSPTRQCPLTNT